jgi:ketosteroid isomerase-like protein
MTSEVIDALAPAAQDVLAARADLHRRQHMKALLKTVLVLVSCLSIDPVLAQPPRAPSEAPAVADTIRRIEHDWVDAMIAGDLDRLAQIVADDWFEGYPGKGATRANFFADVKAGKHKLVGCEFGPSDVKVFGDVAVLQGSVTETRIKDGQRNTFQVAYMDVWVKRGDRWMVVRSFAKKL